VATWANTSFIRSLASTLLCPSNLNKRKICTCKNGSATPLTSCSALKLLVIKLRKILTKRGTFFK